MIFLIFLCFSLAYQSASDKFHRLVMPLEDSQNQKLYTIADNCDILPNVSPLDTNQLSLFISYKNSIFHNIIDWSQSNFVKVPKSSKVCQWIFKKYKMKKNKTSGPLNAVLEYHNLESKERRHDPSHVFLRIFNDNDQDIALVSLEQCLRISQNANNNDSHIIINEVICEFKDKEYTDSIMQLQAWSIDDKLSDILESDAMVIFFNNTIMLMLNMMAILFLILLSTSFAIKYEITNTYIRQMLRHMNHKLLYNVDYDELDTIFKDLYYFEQSNEHTIFENKEH